MAGDIALKSPEPDIAKAEAYFERALAVARKQQAKYWELLAPAEIDALLTTRPPAIAAEAFRMPGARFCGLMTRETLVGAPSA